MTTEAAPILKNLDDVLRAIRSTDNPDELATLMSLANELFAEGKCICNSKPSMSDEGLICRRDVNEEREKMHQTFLDIIELLRSK